MKNVYKEHFEAYIKRKISVIPDKFGSKKPAISEWSKYCDVLPTLSEARMWAEELEESGIAVCLGKASGIVALDLDTENQDILNEILHLLPKSPVEKFGSKGFTRFFRYMEDNTESLKVNGDVILEILSTGKKASLPPSIHPNGSEYRWTSEKTLLDVNVAELPVLPPALISHLQMKLSQKFTDGSVDDYGRVNSGRNSTLSAKLGDLLNEVHTADTILKELIKFDQETNNPPYFTDPNEHRTTEPITNALAFYASHMVSINYKRLRDNKEYIKPILPSDVKEINELAKKPSGQVSSEKLNLDLLPAPSVIKIMIDTLLENSWVRQPQLAVGSVLATLSTLISRKFIFQGISPNLYILNVSASGSGKNAGLEFVKDTFMQCSATKMLIAGDIGSDAGITDNLSSKPQCLYLMDEMGGILKSINKSGGEYTSKVADILAELFTCSNSAFLGRTLKEGVVGSCDRPNVNILGATTPTGFKEGLTRESIDKGLMGRFLIFEGDPLARSTRVNTIKQLPREVLNQLNWIVSYRPQEGFSLQNREQLVTELTATPSANNRLDEIFEEFDQLRIDNIFEPSSPIVSRLYQQMIKLVIIHAVANSEQQIPKIEVRDVEFGYLIIKNYYANISRILDENLFDNQHQRNKALLLHVIKKYEWCSKSTLIEGTPQLTKQQRNSLLDELIEAELIVQDVVQENGKLKQYFKGDYT